MNSTVFTTWAKSFDNMVAIPKCLNVFEMVDCPLYLLKNVFYFYQKLKKTHAASCEIGFGIFRELSQVSVIGRRVLRYRGSTFFSEIFLTDPFRTAIPFLGHSESNSK